MSTQLKPVKVKTSATARKALSKADEQIALLKARILPHDPHLLRFKVDLDPSRPVVGREISIEEYKGTAFQNYEVKQLQYMTLISDDVRESLAPYGDWKEEIERGSPASIAARSNTTTPNPARDPAKPRKKIAFGDYKNKNLNRGAMKDSPKPGGEGHVNGHSRNTSAVMGGTPMSRLSSFEGPAEVKGNGAKKGADVKKGNVNAKEHDRPSATSSRPADTKLPPKPVTNGHAHSASNSSMPGKDANRDPRSQKPTNPPLPRDPKHTLPPRPHSPPRRAPDSKPSSQEVRPQKRSLDSGASQPEKRTRIENPRPSPNPNAILPRKLDHLNVNKPSPRPSQNSHSTPARTSPLGKKNTPTKRIDTSRSSSSSAEKPLPPLLSPLPADLDASPLPPASSLGSMKKNDLGKNSSQSTPSKVKPSSDTIIVKKPKGTDSPHSGSSSPFVLPRLLSPGLPEPVEKELREIQLKGEKKAEGKKSEEKKSEEKNKLDSVVARHEKARRPDTPGVARKISAPKVGHPPKKTPGSSSKPKPAPEEPKPESKPSLIVNFKIPKRKRKDVSRILGIKGRPDKTFLKLEEERIGKKDRPEEPEPRTASKTIRVEEPEHKPTPKTAGKTVSSSTASKTPASSSKKRTSEAFDREPEPSNKRPKTLSAIDVPKSKTSLEPPFKSPAVTVPNQKTLLSTPKKGDALKSVAMRRVDSADGHARTPQTQTANTSTPASAEKPRMNGTMPHPNPHRPGPPQQEPLSPEQQETLTKQSQAILALGTQLKRRMDEIMHFKDRASDPLSLPENTKKLGLATGIECLVYYLNGFLLGNKAYPSLQYRTNLWEGGLGLCKFVEDKIATLGKYPVLRVVCAVVVAMFREGLEGVYLEHLEREGGNAFGGGARNMGRVVDNGRERGRLWGVVGGGLGVLKEFGGNGGREVEGGVGPWMDGERVKVLVEGVLGKWCRREGVEWRKLSPEGGEMSAKV